ncbi:MAG TPA: GNAT family N-acetyltransferase [Micromonosporaceae bacterium]|nr:GNAT family N-acetyltransferase [Micromonosporaceae bacterium]
MLLRRDDGYEVCDDDTRLDVDLVHQWLSQDAYWALGRSRDTVARSLARSVSFGLYRPDGGQVGFARLVTDQATFAWLCDVYVERSERGKGLGVWLVGSACDLARGWGLRRVVLATADAHGIYARLGFTPMVQPDHWMELRLR